MKIVIDGHILRQSSGRYVERLLSYLQQIDSSNEYVVLLKPTDYDSWPPPAANFNKLVYPFKRYSIASQFQMARLLYSQKADIVHFTFQPDVFTTFVALIYWKKKVFTIHDLTQLRIKNRKRNWLLFQVLYYSFKLLLRLNVWAAAAIIVPTNFVKKDAAKYLWYPKRKISVTYEAADLAGQQQPHPLPALKNKRFILYVGTAHAHKNLAALVDAFKMLRASSPDLMLVLAGKKDVFYDRLEQYIQNASVEGVVLPGYVSDAELAWLYKNCEAYVFPSLSEGFGLPGLEAMSYGAPVASSNATCLPEVYGDAAHYFDPKDPKDMARAIGEVLDDKKLRDELIKNGHEQLKKYSWKKMAEQTLRIYESVNG